MTEVVTEGTGWHEQTADRAELSFNFAAAGRDRAGAVTALGEQVAAVEPVLATPGVQVRSRHLWVGTEWKNRRRVGCRASEEITLRVIDLAVLEDVLNQLVAAEPATLNGPQWMLEEQAAAVRLAQKAAVQDARERAEGYAAALSAELGELLRLSEADGRDGPPGIFRAAVATAGAGAPVDVSSLGLEPELVRVTARCTTTWSLAL